jgi:hypothetical protein
MGSPGGIAGRRSRYLARPVTEVGATPQDRLPFRAARDWTASHRTATAAIVYGLVAAAAAVAAFVGLFSGFAFYDDEGTLLVALKAFANGQVLYRDIYAAYGPLFFDVFGGFFALTGIAVTSDASRLLVGVDWIATSVLFGLSAQRLTGRLALGVAGMIVAFAALGVFGAEPMHPQVLIAPLLGAITLLIASGPTSRVAWAGAATGALLAGLVLTKVNVGGYAVIAAVVAAVLAWEPLSRRRWLRWLAVAGPARRLGAPAGGAGGPCPGRGGDRCQRDPADSRGVLGDAAALASGWPCGRHRGVCGDPRHPGADWDDPLGGLRRDSHAGAETA